MAFKLNEIQEKSVNTINTNLSLRAGAGTGKTKVLTERFLNIIENGNLTKGHEFDEILAITFTNKAAEEMKGRILKAIKNRKNEKEFSDLYKYFSKANIYTIHGFCAKVLKENPLEAGINPDFTVADENISNFLLEESCNEILNDEINKDILVDFLIKKEDMNLKNLIMNLKSLYLDIRNNSYTIEELKNKHNDFMKNINTLSDFNTLFKLLDEYSELVTRGKFPKLYKSKEYSDFLINKNTDFLPEILDNLGTAKGNGKEEIRERIIEEINKINLLREIDLNIYYDLIFDILEKIDKKYTSKKYEKSLLDYNDLQYKSYEVIKNTDNYKYKYIMIDEFQDTDRLQSKLFRELSSLSGKNAKIFVVGDPKQSIYGFRGSNLREYNKFTKEIADNGTELVMMENYRSSKELMNSFNSVFSYLMGNMYDSLTARAELDNYKIEIIEAQSEEEDTHLQEAQIIAEKISRLIKSGIKKRDIAVLYRRKSYIHLLEKELTERGISVNNTSVDFVNKTEIKDIIIVLKAISNKRDFLSLLSYLRSPMAGLNDNSLVIIAKYFNRDEYILEDMYIQMLDEKEQELYKKAFDKIIYLNKLKSVLSLSEIIQEVVKINEYIEIASVLYGNTSTDNIYTLMEIAEEFEREYSSNICEFLKYLSTSPIETAGIDDAVSLMTIHKSKGLEFDNVIIAEMNNRFNTKMNDNFFAISEYGLAFNFKDINAKYSIIKNQYKDEAIMEEMRMLYVAMTRAKIRLILSNNSSKQINKNSYMGFIKDYIDNQGEDIFKREIIEIDADKKSEDRSINEKIFSIKPEISQNNLIKERYIEKVKKVKYYSASAFMVFKKSKREYYRRYILGEEVVDNKLFSDESMILDPIIRGNIIHKYAEIVPKDIDSFIDKSLAEYGIVKNESIISLLKEQIYNYHKSLKGDVIYKELEFYYKLKNGVIHGFIDQVRNENGIVILDFKTGYDSDEDVLKYYYPQLQIYTKVFQEITKEKVKEAKILLLSINKEVSVDISDDKLNSVIHEFEEFIDFVENHRDMKDYN